MQVTIDEYRRMLADHYAFAECIMVHMRHENACRDLLVVVDFIWEREGVVRSDFEGPNPLLLRFGRCRRMSLENNLRLKHLSRVRAPWGLSEFACITVADEGRGWFLFRIGWEGRDRLIEVSARDFTIARPAKPSEWLTYYPKGYLEPRPTP